MDLTLVVTLALLWIVVLFNLVLTLALIRRVKGLGPTPQTRPLAMLEKGQLAPNFTAETLHGQEITLSSYGGRKVAFAFIQPGCGPCQELIPTLRNLAPKAKADATEIILVSVSDAKSTEKLVEELGISDIPVLVAPRETSTFADDYKAAVTPWYCIVDEEARVFSNGVFSSKEWISLAETWNTIVPQPA